MLFGVNLPHPHACKYCKSPEIRKKGLYEGFIINARGCCACGIIQAREEIVLFFVLLIIGLIGGALAVLVVENFSIFATGVQLSFFTWYTPSLPIGLWLVISCLCGASILYLLSIPITLRERHELYLLRKRVEELEQAQQSAQGGSTQGGPSLIVPIPGISVDFMPPSTPPQL